jgi:hypothetical protein
MGGTEGAGAAIGGTEGAGAAVGGTVSQTLPAAALAANIRAHSPCIGPCIDTGIGLFLV